MTRRSNYSRLLVFLAVIGFLVVGLLHWLKRHSQKAGSSPDPRSEQVSTVRSSPPTGPTNGHWPSPAAIQQGVLPASPVAREGAAISRAEKLKGAVETMNVPIVFWGKVVDQDDAPLEGVTVRARVRSWHVVTTPDGDAIFATKVLASGSDGRFKIDGGLGEVLTIEALKKDGYDPEPKALRSFGYTTSDPMKPDPNNPVVLKMWKADRKAQLFTGNKRFPLVPDGRVYTVDLLLGTLTESTAAEGDLRVSIRRASNAAWGQRYDWSLEIQPVSGGLLEEADSQSAMFQAPEDGYTDKYRLEASAADPSWSYGTGTKRFYLKTRAGQNYARIEVEAYAYYLQDKQSRLNIAYAVNPAGERTLR